VPAKTPAIDCEFTESARRSCLLAKDAVVNVVDLLDNTSQMTYLVVKECEHDLDRIESQADERLPSAITKVGERKARELLACFRFITELERIGDLMLGVANRIRMPNTRLPAKDIEQVKKMAEVLEAMLDGVHQGFISLDVELARAVLARDRAMDRLRNEVFHQHWRKKNNGGDASVETLFVAQAFERAGDHATNVAEELLHLVEGRSFRHLPKRKTEN
jgi:phosphate transport system protein